MLVLESHIDPSDPTFKANRDRMQQLVAELRERVSRAAPARAAARNTSSGIASRASCRSASASTACSTRARRSSSSRRSRPGTCTTTTRPGARHRHRHRPRLGPRGDDRRQRRHRQGRHLLPDHGQEARARAADRARESPAVHLPRRFGRRVSAAPGRGLSRSRALRAHLLQSGAHVGRTHSADRRRHGIVHGGRRVRAGDVRRDDHRQRHRHDLPGRPAAREGRDRREEVTPKSSAAPTSTRGSPASPTTSPRTTPTRSELCRTIVSTLNTASACPPT